MVSAGIAVLLHVQKLWITSAESNDLLALAQRFEWRDGTKLAMNQCFGRLGGAKLALDQHFGWPDNATSALDQRSGCPSGAKLALERRLEFKFKDFTPLDLFHDAKPRRKTFG